jgi:AraC-like DNA-binding protein
LQKKDDKFAVLEYAGHMKYEYELISHNYIRGFHLFLVRILYRTPHLHREFEVNLILDGSVEILSQGRGYHAETGDFFVFDPYQPHELRAREGTVLILSIQISPAFFSDYFPQMESVRFGTEIFHRAASLRHQQLYRQLLELTCCYCQKAPFYELDCARDINALFRALLDVSAFTVVSEAERPAQRARQERVRYLAERIEGGFSEKLLLGDLAKELGVDLYYLSHFFREHFGLSFQEYLAKLRCEKARRELLLTDRSLLDISLSCGFSSPKYFQRAFQKQYGATPKEYRRQAPRETGELPAASVLTSQEFLSDQESLRVVQRLLEQG